MMTRRALIIGGGVAGLSAAWWLANAGWRVTVLERAPALRSGGYMIGISGPGYDTADRMGLLPALKARHVPIAENVYRGRTGKVLWRVRYPDLLDGVNWVTLARTELVHVLFEAVRDRVDIRFGTSVSAIGSGVGPIEVDLTDGSGTQADLVIGADGVHSTVRSMMFGAHEDRIERLGYRCAAFQIPDALNLGHDFLSYAEPGRITEFYTLSTNRVAALFVWRCTDPGTIRPDRMHAALKAAYDGAHPHVQQTLAGLPDDAPIYFDALEMVDLPKWSSGRCLLLGDAAHCLTLLSGQGSGMAMTSAWLLNEALAAYGIDMALAHHEAKLRPSITRLQARSRKIASVFVPASRWSFRLRNAVMRLTPPKLLGRYLVASVQKEAERIAAGIS